jgi:hypothetical protein
VAVADLGAVIVTLHVLAVPLQAPDQPTNVARFPAVAVSVTTVPVA